MQEHVENLSSSDLDTNTRTRTGKLSLDIPLPRPYPTVRSLHKRKDSIRTQEDNIELSLFKEESNLYSRISEKGEDNNFKSFSPAANLMITTDPSLNDNITKQIQIESASLLSPRKRRLQEREAAHRRFPFAISSPFPYMILLILLAMVVMIFIDLISISGLVCITAVVMVSVGIDSSRYPICTCSH